MQNQDNLNLPSLITIEVAYAASYIPDKQSVIKIQITDGWNIQQAIEASRILYKYPEINLQTNQVGIFGKIKNLSTILKNGDRVEIYRNLIRKPNESRIWRSKN